MAVIMIPFDRGFHDRAIHPFDLVIGLGMFAFGELVLDPVLV